MSDCRRRCCSLKHDKLLGAGAAERIHIISLTKGKKIPNSVRQWLINNNTINPRSQFICKNCANWAKLMLSEENGDQNAGETEVQQQQQRSVEEMEEEQVVSSTSVAEGRRDHRTKDEGKHSCSTAQRKASAKYQLKKTYQKQTERFHREFGQKVEVSVYDPELKRFTYQYSSSGSFQVGPTEKVDKATQADIELKEVSMPGVSGMSVVEKTYPSPAKRPKLSIPKAKVDKTPMNAKNGLNHCRVCEIAYTEPRSDADLKKGLWIGCQFSKECPFWVHASCKGLLIVNEAEAEHFPFYCLPHMRQVLKKMEKDKERVAKKSAPKKGNGKAQGQSNTL